MCAVRAPLIEFINTHQSEAGRRGVPGSAHPSPGLAAESGDGWQEQGPPDAGARAAEEEEDAAPPGTGGRSRAARTSAGPCRRTSRPLSSASGVAGRLRRLQRRPMPSPDSMPALPAPPPVLALRRSPTRLSASERRTSRLPAAARPRFPREEAREGGRGGGPGEEEAAT